ncbi:MAG: penicillin-binding protein 2 [bacterium]
MWLKKYFIKNKARENIEAEEIFLDAEAIRSLEEKGKLEQSIKHRNFIFLYLLVIFCLLGLFFRAGYLQIIKGEYYQDLAKGNRLRIYSTTAPRGIIYDRFNKPLVYNIPSFDLVVILADFLDNSPEIQDEILDKIADVFVSGEEDIGFLEKNAIKKEINKKIEDASGRIGQLVLFKNVKRDLALILETFVNDWNGLRLEKNAQRQYALGPYFSHILGYTGDISQSDLENNSKYSSGDQIGKDGLERQYEDLLRGELGQEQVEVDSFGKTQRLLAVKKAEPGKGLVLSIDRNLQENIYQSLVKMLNDLSMSGNKTKKATVVAVNPNNGGILGLVSLPSFDNNLLVQGISQAELSSLSNDPNQPFLNRAVDGQYPSGSIIKPLIGAAALEEGIVGRYEQINCYGGINIVNEYNPQIVYNFPDWKTHGLTDMIKAIAESCNVFFYTVGGGYGQIDGLGVERIKEYLSFFGLGQATKIDLPHEEIGLIPDREWKKEEKPQEEWYLGDTYHLSIGQGDILVTPLQMALAISSIANGGILYQPWLVDKVIDLDGNIIKDMPVNIVRENFIQSDNLEIIRKGMRQAVLSGSAVSLSSLEVESAGKTGTAQFGTEGDTHAWFVGFAPYDDPQIVLVVLVEGGGEGNSVAVPVAKNVLEWYFSQ